MFDLSRLSLLSDETTLTEPCEARSNTPDPSPTERETPCAAGPLSAFSTPDKVKSIQATAAYPEHHSSPMLSAEPKMRSRRGHKHLRSLLSEHERSALDAIPFKPFENYGVLITTEEERTFLTRSKCI